MGYAAPAGGVLCLTLLQGTQTSVSRSKIVQELSKLIAFLEWVQSRLPNSKLCQEVMRVIQRVLDQTLNNLQALNFEESWPSSLDTPLDVSSFFSFSLLDTFDWIPQQDWSGV